MQSGAEDQTSFGNVGVDTVGDRFFLDIVQAKKQNK